MSSSYELQAAAAKYAMTQTGSINACGCIGPQNGEPLCPCSMRNVQVKNDRWVIPERDLGPVRVIRLSPLSAPYLLKEGE